jgi:hypothetical protein
MNGRNCPTGKIKFLENSYCTAQKSHVVAKEPASDTQESLF